MKNSQLLLTLCVLLIFVLTGSIIFLKKEQLTPQPSTSVGAAETSTPAIVAEIPEPTTPTLVIEKLNEREPFGFVVGVKTDEGQPTLIFDAAEWFSDEAAEKAMIEDGACEAASPSEPHFCAPSGFYIRNNSTSTIALPLATGLKFFSQEVYAHSLPSKKFDESDLDYFIRIAEDPATQQKHGVMPITYTVLRGNVVEIKEVYIP